MAERHGPVRTCIGCRERTAREQLVRHVLERTGDGSLRVVRDDARRRPGRGAWLHDLDRCRQLAAKRRAFRRALRVPGSDQLDDGVVDEA
ncbi:MAG: DUF448 domain-containing protein [Thermoleophilia bacterium]|nr:DUF448 domain-containing protein [Thermoleophilia bacterium]